MESESLPTMFKQSKILNIKKKQKTNRSSWITLIGDNQKSLASKTYLNNVYKYAKYLLFCCCC